MFKILITSTAAKRYAALPKNVHGFVSLKTINERLKKQGRHEISNGTWTLWSILLDFDAYKGLPLEIFVRMSEAKRNGEVHPAERAMIEIQSEPKKFPKRATRLARLILEKE